MKDDNAIKYRDLNSYHEYPRIIQKVILHKLSLFKKKIIKFENVTLALPFNSASYSECNPLCNLRK